MIHIALIDGHQSPLIRIALLHKIQKFSLDETITQILFHQI